MVSSNDAMVAMALRLWNTSLFLPLVVLGVAATGELALAGFSLNKNWLKVALRCPSMELPPEDPEEVPSLVAPPEEVPSLVAPPAEVPPLSVPPEEEPPVLASSSVSYFPVAASIDRSTISMTKPVEIPAIMAESNNNNNSNNNRVMRQKRKSLRALTVKMVKKCLYIYSVGPR